MGVRPAEQGRLHSRIASIALALMAVSAAVSKCAMAADGFGLHSDPAFTNRAPSDPVFRTLMQPTVASTTDLTGDQAIEESSEAQVNCGITISDVGNETPWYYAVESLVLWRDNAHRIWRTISAPSSSDTTDDHSAAFDAGIGPRILVGYRSSEEEYYEVNYFSVFGMIRRTTGTLQSSLDPIPGNLLGGSGDQLGPINVPFIFVRTTFIEKYSSDIHSIEFDDFRQLDRVSIFAGLRLIDLSEQLSSTWNTNNLMIGVQLGPRWKNASGNWRFEATGKAGIYCNVVTWPAHCEAVAAFAGEVNASLGYRISDKWWLRGGYNAIWIDQAADVPDWWSSGAPFSSVFLHGIDSGLEARW
jgi:hypothetical protein